MRNVFVNLWISRKCHFVASDWDCTELNWSNHECIEASQFKNLSYHSSFKFWKDKASGIYHPTTCNLFEQLEHLKSSISSEISFFRYVHRANCFHLFLNCSAQNSWIMNFSIVIMLFHFNFKVSNSTFLRCRWYKC